MAACVPKVVPDFATLQGRRLIHARDRFEALPMDLRSVLHTELSRPLTTLELKTSGLTGKITGYSQTVASASSKLVMDAKSSTSLDRAPAEHSSMIRGKSTYFPFRPGGLPSSYQILEDESEDIVVRTEQGFEDAFEGIQSCPPGFEHGLDFDADQDDPSTLGVTGTYGRLTPLCQTCC
jgi:antiviral helicase SKI2